MVASAAAATDVTGSQGVANDSSTNAMTSSSHGKVSARARFTVRYGHAITHVYTLREVSILMRMLTDSAVASSGSAPSS